MRVNRGNPVSRSNLWRAIGCAARVSGGLLLVFALAGCSEKEEASPQAAQVAPAEIAPAPPSHSIPGVPDLDLTVVPNAAHAKARKLNGAALKHHKKALWSQAIASYIEGLRHNPGHILLRYNLGCAYAMNGQRKEALQILEQFHTEEGCPPCVGRLVRAKKDTDYRSLWADPTFGELTADAVVYDHDYKKITKRFLKNMGKAYWALMKKTVDAGYGFAVQVDRPKGHQGWHITDGSSLAKWKIGLGGKQATMLPGAHGNARISCRGTCCTVKSSGGEYTGEVATIKNVCFWPVGPDTVYLRRLALTME